MRNHDGFGQFCLQYVSFKQSVFNVLTRQLNPNPLLNWPKEKNSNSEGVLLCFTVSKENRSKKIYFLVSLFC